MIYKAIAMKTADGLLALNVTGHGFMRMYSSYLKPFGGYNALER